MNQNMLAFERGMSGFKSERKKTRENFKIGFNSTYALIMLLAGALGLYYVWTLNVNATNGFTLRQLEIEHKGLRIEKELLEVRVAELESLNYIVNSEVTQEMTKAQTPEYFVLEGEKTFAYINEK